MRTIELSPPATTAPSRGRRLTRTAIASVAVLILAASGVAVAGEALKHHDQTGFTADGVRQLVIRQDSGDVTLIPEATAGQVRVTTSRRWSWQEPRVSHTVKDSVLTLTSDPPAFRALGNGEVDQEVTVPPGVAVRVEISAGNIRATGLKVLQFGVSTGSGAIEATDVEVSRFSAVTGSGSIQASLSGGLERINARTSSGSVELTVPDARYNVDAATSLGQLRVEVIDDPAASRLISAHTSAGHVTIRRR